MNNIQSTTQSDTTMAITSDHQDNALDRTLLVDEERNNDDVNNERIIATTLLQAQSDGERNDDDVNNERITATTLLQAQSQSILLCQLGCYSLVLLKPSLFLRKTVLIVLASYALLPLLLYKSSLPGALYVSLLVLIHVLVLVVYLYGIRFGELDVDRLSLGGRILGLGVTIWLLTVVSGWEQEHDHNLEILAAQMLVLCLVHTIVLAFLMVAVQQRGTNINCHSDSLV